MTTSKATFIGAVPAISEVRVVVPGVPAKVVLELTVLEAEQMRALLGKTTGEDLYGPYNALDGMATRGLIRHIEMDRTAPSIKLEFNK